MHYPECRLPPTALGWDCHRHCRISHVLRAQPRRLVDEIDLALDAVAVDEDDHASVGSVIIDLRNPHVGREQLARLLDRPDAALKVDVLAGQRLGNRQVRILRSEVTGPPGNRLAADEDDSAFLGQRSERT